MRRRIVALLVAANCFVFGIAGYAIYKSRLQYESRAQTFTQNTAQAVDYTLSNSIEKIDFALIAIADELQQELAGNGFDGARLAALAARYQERLPEVDAFRISDASGKVIFGKGLDPNAGVSWADRDYFSYLRDHPETGLHISGVQMGKVSQRLIFCFERRYNRPDGTFGGIVAAPITLDHFTHLLSQFVIRNGQTLALRDLNLGLIARTPAVAGPAGKPGSTMVSNRLQELVRSGAPAATYDAILATDGRMWTVSYRRMKAAPLIVLVGLAKDDYLANWHADLEKTAFWALGFLLLSALYGWRVLALQAGVDRESAGNRLFLRHAVDGICILDEQGCLLQASEQFCAMLGYAREEMLGMNIAQWESGWPGDALIEQVFPGWLEADSAVIFDTVYRKKDGSLIDVEVHAAGFDMERRRCLFASARDVGQQKKQQIALAESENRLRQSEERYRLLLENSPLGILHFDRNLIVTYANDRFAEIMQVPEGYMLGLDCNKLQDKSVLPPMRGAALGEVGHYEGEYVTSYGQARLWVSMHCGPVRNAKGDILGGVVVVEDITVRMRLEEEQRRQREELALAASVFTHAHEGIMICDARETILDVNPTFSEITGYERGDIIGKTPRFLSSKRQDAVFYRAMWQSIREQGHWQGELWNRRRDGSEFAVRLNISVVRNEQNQVTYYIGTFSDISQLKLHQAALERMAHYDQLTHLPNRALLSDRMGQALAQARRNGSQVTVGYLDLDGFKAINDELGHQGGDVVLIEIARRLRDMLRAADTVARLGGDEFVLLLIDVDGRDECEQVATRVLRAIAAPIRIGDQERCVSGSLGIALFPHDGDDADALLRHADQAMYMAKEAGKNRYVFFGDAANHSAHDRDQAEQRLKLALEKGELQLHYQPIVDMHDGSVLRLEGLVRWCHPERGVLLPAEFLPAAEGTVLEIALGKWALGEGLSQLARWRLAGMPQGLNINVSSGYLLSPAFCDDLEMLLRAHPELEPRALEIEILESTAMVDIDATIAVFQRCHQLGITIALDDFGSGYSSLACFRRLPVDTLKIDQAFVQSILGDAEDLAVVESVVRLTHAFNRRLIAEGVESVEIGMLLLHLGCRVGQGFGVAHPMPAEDVPAWVKAYVPDRNWTLPMGDIPDLDMPLLLAELEHRAWMRQMDAWLNGLQEAPPPLDHRQCRFGQWYAGPGKQRYGHVPVYAAIGDVHETVHHLGLELVRLCSAGQREEARRRFAESAARRDELLALLASLRGHVLTQHA